MSAFLTDDAKSALLDAVRAIETVSGAELSIAVRPRSGPYLHADLLAGIATGLAVLALQLFLPQSFGLLWFLIDPLVAGALAAFLSSRSLGLRRALTRRAQRRSAVETAARALFVERRVHGTTARGGILFYVSLLEREAVLVVDLGAETALAGAPEWASQVAGIESAVRGGAGGVAVARRLRSLAGPLAELLPRRSDDVNELPDEVDAP
jgi:uncharacterized membrane protein